MVIFVAVKSGMDYPEFLPAIFFYLIAYALLSKNIELAKHPNPFYRVKSFERFSHRFPYYEKKVFISPGDGIEESEKLRVVDDYRAMRVKAFLYEFIMIGLSAYNVYNKTTPIDPSTVATSQNFLSSLYMNYLHYVITLVRGKSSRSLLQLSSFPSHLHPLSPFPSSNLQASEEIDQFCKLEDTFHLQGDSFLFPHSHYLVHFPVQRCPFIWSKDFGTPPLRSTSCNFRLALDSKVLSDERSALGSFR
jgi:hypothetical protein